MLVPSVLLVTFNEKVLNDVQVTVPVASPDMVTVEFGSQVPLMVIVVSPLANGLAVGLVMATAAGATVSLVHATAEDPEIFPAKSV